MAGENIVGLSLDTDFLKNLDKADKAMDGFLKKSQEVSKGVIKAFQDMSEQGVGQFIAKISELEAAFSKIGKKNGIKNIENDIKNVVDKSAKFLELMSKINNDDANKTKNSAVTKINEELEISKKRLGELQNLLNFYAKGEGKKAIGFVDTSAIQQEAKALMNRIDLLEREKASIQANARLRMEVAAKQEQKDKDWNAMENERRERIKATAKAESDAARESSNAYKKSYEERYRSYEQMFDIIEKKEARLQSIMRSKAYQNIQNTGDTSKQATASFNRLYSDVGNRSIRNMELSIQRMQQAQRKLNTDTEEGKKKYDELSRRIGIVYANINRATESSRRFGQENKNLLNTADQLKRAFTGFFAVSSVIGYVKNLRDVRGEFEMQHRSLQILIGDLDKANTLWNKTVALAVKSPFRVKELVSYTKQLAAYRVESDKLYDVNKMLADVSSGLGVDMQRLILAYGQVKAANFLRGTELRQFSEAGVNMLEELSKLYTEIEGRTVSVGDVFERVSKRLVTFEDVHEIFKRITSEGGTFYKMQEKQSETLRGQIMNLRDSIDLMLNSIGEANDGVLKWSVSQVRALVENWENVANAIKLVLPLLALYKLQAIASSSATMLLAIDAGVLTNAIPKQLNMLQLLRVGWNKVTLSAKKFGTAMKNLFTGTGGWMLAIAALTTAIYEIATWYDELNEKIGEINDRRDEELSKIKELTREYAKLNKERNKNNVEEKRKIVSKLIEQAEDMAIEIPLDINELEDNQLDNVIADIEKTISESINFGAELERQIAEGLTDAEGWFNIFGDNLNSDLEELSKASAKFLGGDENTLKKFLNEVGNAYESLTDEAKKYYDTIEEGKKEEETDEEFLLRKIELAQKINNLYVKEKDWARYSSKMNSLEEKRLKIISKQNEVYYELDKVIKRLVEAYDVQDFSNFTDEQKNTFRFRIDKAFEQMQLDESTKRMAKHYLANKLQLPLEVKIESDKPLEDWQKRVLDAVKDLGDLNSVIFGEKQVKGKQKEQVQNYVKSLVESANDIIKEFDIPNQQIISEEDYELAKKQLPILEKIAAIVGIDLNKNNKEDNKDLEKRISLIKEMHKQYLDLRKEYDHATAMQKVMNDYAKAYALTFDGFSLKGKVVDDEELKKLRESGKISEEVLSKIEDLKSKGSFIRDFTEDAVLDIKQWEHFVSEAYNIGDGRWTIGYGETKGVKEGDKMTQEEADMQLRKRLTDDFAKSLNKVLDANKDLILTQTQYNTLLDLTYQGGEGAVKRLLKLSKDEDLAINHINNIYNKIKKELGEEQASRFGEAFVNKFKEAENIYERISMLLETMNLTVNGGKISKKLYSSLQKRSDARALAFLYEKEFTQVIDKITTDFSTIDISTKEGVAKFLESLRPLAEKKGKEALQELEKTIGNFRSESELEIMIYNREKTEREIESLFSNYEMSIDLENIGIKGDLAEQLFNVKPTTLKELREAVEKQIQKLRTTSEGVLAKDSTDEERKLAENNLKLAQKMQDKLKKLEQDSLKERAKDYVKYLEEGMSNRIKIRIEELKKLRELEEMNEFTDQQKKDIREGIRKDTQKQLDIDEWEQFKESEIYSYMFEDLENVGNRTISALLEKLEGLKDSLSHLPADKYKEIVKEIEKLEKLKLEYNPFKALENASADLEEFKKLNKGMFSDMSYKGLEKSFIESETKKKELEEEIELTDMVIKAREQGRDLTSEEAEKIGISNDLLDKSLQALYGIKRENEYSLKTETERSKKAKEGKDAYEEQSEAVKAVASNIEAWAQSLNGVLDGIDSILDAFGVAEDDSSRIWIESTKQIANMAVQVVFLKAALIEMEIAANSALGVIGIIGVALTAVGTMFSAIFQAHDKGLEKRIEKWQYRVERLQKSYETLEKRISEAYAALDVASNERLARSNIQEQIRAYQNMIDAENAKKKTDNKRIQEWYDAIADLREQEKELMQENIENFGGSFDFRSTTREFVDAWVDAFKETGNGLYGLQENFSDFFSNVIAEQAVMQGASAIMKPLLDSINSALAGDYTITEKEFNAIGDLQEQQLAKLDEFLEGWYSRYGDYLEVGEMSGLQRGIEGVSESTAQIIEALLNSMRFYVADSNTQLKTLVAAQVGASDANTPNPMLDQLKVIARQTTAIYELLDSVVGSGHPRGKSGIRVFVD